MAEPKTIFRGPWPGVTEPVIVDRAYSHSGARNKGQSKYNALFDKLRVGKAVRCNPDDRRVIAQALNAWLKRRAQDKKFRAAYDTGDDGLGYVYLIER
jgi:hypothetical protein